MLVDECYTKLRAFNTSYVLYSSELFPQIKMYIYVLKFFFSFPFAKGLMYTTAVDWCDGTGSSMYDCSPACCLSFGSSSSWLCDCEV